MNEGKIFERNFKTNCDTQGVFVKRLNDTDISFNGNSVSKFTPQSACDFFVFGNAKEGRGNLIAIECKSTKYKSISIQRDPNQNAMIKINQIKSLVDMSQFEGVIAGLLLNFRDEDHDTDSTYFINIKDFSRFLSESEKSSINKSDLVLYDATIVESTKKRKYYSYNIIKMVEEVCERNEELLNN